MNAKQSLKLASQKILELEDYNRRCVADIKLYNAVIQGMIAGNNPCEMCEEFRLGECEHQDQQGHGCSGWWLTTQVEIQEEEGDDDSQGILSPGPCS